MKTLLAVLLFASTLNSHALVAVYSQKLQVVTRGAGAVSKQVATGYLIIEAETQKLLLVNVDAKRGGFSMVYPSDYKLETVTTGLGKDSTVITFAGSYSGSMAFKGSNKTIDLYAAHNYRTPKQFAASGNILKKDGDTVLLQECSGVYVYSTARTWDANVFDNSLAETEQRLRENLVQKGYIEQ